MSRPHVTGPFNVLLINCHDLGRFIGPYGISTVHTPNLDRLAGQSVVFERAFAAAPQCSPSRAALFTGRYPQQNGVLGLTHAPFSWDLRDPMDHVAHHLGSAGYHTALVGVQHESRVLADDTVARRLGFDSVRTGGMGDVVADRAIAALSECAESGQPFYLQVGFYEPHRIPSRRDEPGVMGFLGDHIDPDASLGVTVPDYLYDDETARGEMAELQGAVRFMDHQVGRVLDALDTAGLRESTVVVFTTDHGLALPRAKCALYDPGLEVALLVRAPFRAAWSGVRVDGLVSHVDVRPTILELLEFPPETGTHGNSLVPLVEQGATASEHSYGQMTYHNYYDPKRSVRSETHKLIVNFSNAPQPMDPTQSWARRTTPREVRRDGVRTCPPVELYDLTSDPGETVNLAEKHGHAHVTAALGDALMTWMREMEDPLIHGAVTSPQHAQVLATLKEVVKPTNARTTGPRAVPPATSDEPVH
ncbi:arylsulfatase A-like enzyme [Haloactinopolyspora alba]|uniref:Arylsulfatase A-like enzyme n=1 Tax=Haloactinopolyspora alba TaxID=648780 RepID=A0A2P8E982_9ACTN|nr:sulfatase [Haloactinopolyspora alba]PSL06014.1 arylsulfatase A-like enzyme [Haloactinopolyspora alba]